MNANLQIVKFVSLGLLFGPSVNNSACLSQSVWREQVLRTRGNPSEFIHQLIQSYKLGLIKWNLVSSRWNRTRCFCRQNRPFCRNRGCILYGICYSCERCFKRVCTICFMFSASTTMLPDNLSGFVP